ncbi:MAG: isoleucine--tRNA ligase [Candidatus Methanoplasma sp.]|jgi:isoleucyl-tRNA synthetase|nr:isoleucine--tRNA ligase [Candidatus Methanoplasma sp.]
MIKQVRANYDAPKIEKEIQEFWRSEHAYETTKELRSKGEKFYFLDGPPYTTGSIHLGTAMNKTVKDIMIRYWRMKGYNVRDQPGFDMHGLPIEVQVEKKIGVHSKKEIEEIGIDKFVDTCKKFANELRISMTEQFKQLGVWMDWDNPYQTLRPDFIESAWWTVQMAYSKGLLGPADRVVTWCPRCETALAEAEIEYWDETDPSVMVRFPLEGEPDVSLVIWTTTPWTLPSNMAVAAHPESTYVRVKLSGSKGEETVVCMETRIDHVMNAGGYESFQVVEKCIGRDLEGLKYVPPFDISPDALKRTRNTYSVVLADYVEDDNTGLVHTAPGFGPDDYETGKRYGLIPFCPVGEAGRFNDDFPMMTGKKVKTANDDIVRYLGEKGVILNSGKMKHRYGHCWRCKSPIIYRNTRQWFIDIPKVKDKMLDEIDRVKWVPDWAGAARERNWVEGAREWCVTRQRYWGIPLPVWECECGNVRVVGQYGELRDGKGYTEGMDPHRPWIDGVTFECDKCGKTMRRVKDVMDVWFDSGVAAWAQMGYPAKKDEFETWGGKGRFIVEAHDQTRGWFYTQLGAGTVSFGHAPYDEVMMHGWVLDPKGQKMSKSLGNVIEPLEIINDLGADSLRFYMVKANAPWDDTAFQKDGPKNARKVLNTYWNVVNFASTYMSIDRYDPGAHTVESVRGHLRDEDRWMLSRTEKLKKSVTDGLEARELHKVARATEDYIMEDLSRWYVRLVRDRSWADDAGSAGDKVASYFTLHYAVMTAALVLAPIAPHISEEVYRHMGGTKLSVHMEDWVVCDESLIDEGLEHSMLLIQNIIEIVASERAKMGSKLRWPLKQVSVRGNDASVNDSVRVFDGVLAQQGNIKSIVYGDGPGETAPFSEGTLAIDFDVTPEIEAEGYARELIRRIQQMRKDMKLNVEQYVNCDVSAEPRLVRLFDDWKDHISGEVRAKKLVFTDSPGGDEVKTWDVTGKDVTIGISAAEQ